MRAVDSPRESGACRMAEPSTRSTPMTSIIVAAVTCNATLDGGRARLRLALGPRPLKEQALRELLPIRKTPDGLTLLSYCVLDQLKALTKGG